jgi:hypothetical protein
MGYYRPKRKRKTRVACCAACRCGIDARWWWELVDFVENPDPDLCVRRFHVECYLPKRDGLGFPVYRGEADRLSYGILHSDVELLRDIAQSGRRFTNPELLAAIRERAAARAGGESGLVAGVVDGHGGASGS